MKRYAAAALMDSHGRVLLGKRRADRVFYPGVWDFIGGHCAVGESYEAAMLREVEEETCALPTVYRHLLTVDRSPEAVLQLFVVFEWEGNIANCAPEEHDELRWLVISEARALPLPEIGYAALLDALETA